ncbi:Hypothetical predicted protein, partial [Olea europaea subsp. europaea]
MRLTGRLGSAFQVCYPNRLVREKLEESLLSYQPAGLGKEGQVKSMAIQDFGLRYLSRLDNQAELLCRASIRSESACGLDKAVRVGV